MSNPIQLVAIAGPAGSGKDTAGRVLIEERGFTKLSFAHGLKAALAAMGFPEPATADEKEKIIPWVGVSWRHLAQTLGTEWGRKLVHADLWVLMAENRIRTEGGKWVITDLRFENEAEMVRRLNGVVCHIDGRAHPMAEGTKGHASEAGVERLPTDVLIDNSPVMVKEGKVTAEDMLASMDKLREQVFQAARYVGA